MTRDASLTRCSALWLTVTALSAGFAAWLAPDLTRLPDGRTFEVLLVWFCEGVATGCAVWLWVVTTSVTLDVLRGRAHQPRRGVPSALRRAVLAACGVAIVGGTLAAPSYAADHRPTRTGSVLAGLPLPDRATAVSRLAVVFSRADHARADHRETAAARPERVTVVEGDTLWRLAARTLPATAADALVADRWHRLYALNRDVIGDDPDLIQPGQQLLLPTGSEEDLS